MPTLAEQIAKARRTKGATPAADKLRPSGGKSPWQAKAKRRLARVRLADPKSLPDVKPTARGNYTKQQRVAILGAARDLNKKQRTAKEKKAADNYNPLSPLTGKDMARELKAAEALRFGSEEGAIKTSLEEHDKSTPVVTSAYDQYKQALTDAGTRIASTYKTAADETQGRVDKAFEQDKAANEARDAAVGSKAQTFGLTVGPSSEGARAVEGARSQGNQAAASTRDKGASANTLMEGRQATSVLSKAEALAKHGDKRKALEKARADLEKERGEFRVDHRGKLRGSEREWAAIQQEFGLKKDVAAGTEAGKAADRKLEQSKINAQKIVARLYASADLAGARAQVRVAKLQLDKGKIDQNQYRTIKNIYEGLPEKGKAPEAKKPASGSSLQSWETDKVEKAVNSLTKASARGLAQNTPAGKAKYMKMMIDGGLSPRLARIAWSRHVGGAKSYDKGNVPG